MSSYKTRARDKGNINNDYVKATRSGTSVVNGSSLSASNLQANLPVKTDNSLILQSTKLEISDTNGLQSALDSAVQYQGTLPAPLGALVKISDSTGNVEDSTITEAIVNGKLDKAGDTMSGNLDMGNNNIDNVNIIKVNQFEPNDNIDPLSIGFSADNISFNSINTTFNGLAGEEVAFRITRQGVNYGEIKTEPDILSLSNFGNSAVNLKLEGVNGNLLLDDTNTKLVSNNLDLDINLNNINNVFRANINRIAPATTTNIDIESDLFLRDNDIKKVGDLNVNTLSVNTLSSITITSDLDLQTTRNIKNCNNLQTNSISATTTDININNRLLLNNNDVLDIGDLELNTLGKNGAGDISLQDNIDVNNFDLKFVSNIDAQDVKTTTLTAYAPLTEIKLGANTDLNLNGNNIIGVGLIDNLQASGGLFSKVDSNVFPNPPATLPVLPTDILGVGSDFGNRTIPANTFKAGSLFSLKIGGSLTCSNNDEFTISVGSNCGAVVNAGSFVIGKQYVINVAGNTNFTLIGSANNNVGTAFIATGVGTGTGNAVEVVIFCNQLVQVEGNQTNAYYELEIDFAIRAIGVAGVAQILTNGSFDYFNNTQVKKGYGFNQLNSQTFDTTIQNQLCILYSSDAVDAFTIDVASITKFY